jgi:hypothetical protein
MLFQAGLTGALALFHALVFGRISNGRIPETSLRAAFDFVRTGCRLLVDRLNERKEGQGGESSDCDPKIMTDYCQDIGGSPREEISEEMWRAFSRL